MSDGESEPTAPQPPSPWAAPDRAPAPAEQTVEFEAPAADAAAAGERVDAPAAGPQPSRDPSAGSSTNDPAPSGTAAPSAPQQHETAPLGTAPYGPQQHDPASSGPPPFGTAPYGPPPSGQPVSGTSPYGQPPYGQPPYGQPPYGQPPYGQPPYGVVPAVPPPGRGRLPWILGAAVLALLLLAGAAVAVRHAWSDRTSTTAANSPAVPAPTVAPDTGNPGASPPDAPSTGAPPAPSGSAPADPTSRSWLAATNAYCRNTTDPALKKAAPLAATDPATYFNRIAAINRELDNLLRKDPPSGLRVQTGQVASDWDRMATLFDQAATAVRQNNRSGAAQLIAQGEVANRLGNDQATQIGLRDCADAGGIGVTGGPTAPGATV